jgi:hypothetical protein
MKIVSHELEMVSQYSFSQELISAKTSFEALLPEEASVEESSELIQDEPRIHPLIQTREVTDVPRCECSLFGIIERLIQSLHERMNHQMESVHADMQEVRESRGRKLSLYEKYAEQESFAFSTQGIIKTECGQEMCIDVDFSMSRSFVIEHKMDVGRVYDPLVINLEGEMPELSQTKFSFDIDNDGEEDQISCPKEGNAFLAWDKNEDGEINQGSELFGTRLGNGFAELAEHDSDKNAWIDENDDIFHKLRVWQHKDNGEKELCALGEAGIGAIYLNNTEADFSYKTKENETLGALRASGIFLHEDGRVGNVSQIDFALGEERDMNTPLGKLLQA